MTDDNVTPLPPPLLRDAVKSVGALADAVNKRSRVVAEALHHSNTLGLNYLCQIAEKWECEKEDRSNSLDLLRRACAIIDRVPREAVTELKERMDGLEKAYKGHGRNGSYDIAHHLIRLGANREMIEVFLDTGTGLMDEDEEAKAQALKQAADKLLELAEEREDDPDEYLAVIEVIKEWYT
jgi:hypothetical protein